MGTPVVLSFELARIATSKRNLIETTEEDELHHEAKRFREVWLPGLDIATAFALAKTGGGVQTPHERDVIHARQLSGLDWQAQAASAERIRQQLNVKSAEPSAELLQQSADLTRVAGGWVVLMHESWPKLHHIVRYFDLIEKNEAPDTPLLEWLIAMGVVPRLVALKTADRFTKPRQVGRTFFVLAETDAARIKLAVDVRKEVEKAEKELPVAKNPETGKDICECVDCINPKADPYPIITRCPACGEKHIDEGEWATKKHKTHQCQNNECPTFRNSGGTKREEWTPALVHTVGVFERFPKEEAAHG